MNEKLIKQYLTDFKSMDLGGVRGRSFSLSASKRIQAIIGARRSGKTYLMYDRMNQLMKQGVSKDKIIYLNFENPVLDDVSYKEFKKIIELHWSLFPESAKQKIYIFIDEPQVIPNWERAVRNLYDELNAEIYITGSSSGLLEAEMATALRGRSIRTLLLPLSFREFLNFKDVNYQFPLNSKQQSLLLYYFQDFLRDGGYPEIAIEEEEQEKMKTLKEYFDLTIFKDLIDRYRINNTRLIKNLIDMAVASCAKEFSVNKHFLDLKSRGFKLGQSTLYEYFDHLQDSLFLFALKKFSYSQKTQDLSIPKIYLGDVGFLNLYSMENFGQRMENAIFLELLRRTSMDPTQNLNYFQDNSGRETDFVINKGRKPRYALQVCYNMENSSTYEREVESLLVCMKELGLKEGVILTQNESREEEREERTIKILPTWQWMLE